MTPNRTIGSAVLAMVCACFACDGKLSGEPESLNATDITLNRSGESDSLDAGLRQGDTTNSLNAGPGATGGTGALSATAGASTAGSIGKSGAGGAVAVAGSGGGGAGGAVGQRDRKIPPVDSAMGAGPNSGAPVRTR